MPKAGSWLGAIALAALVAVPEMASAGPRAGHAAVRGGAAHGGAAFRGAAVPRGGGAAFRGVGGTHHAGAGLLGRHVTPVRHGGRFVAANPGYYDSGYLTYARDGAVYAPVDTAYAPVDPGYAPVYPDYGPAYGPVYYETDVDYGAAIAAQMIPAVISIMRRAAWAGSHRRHARSHRRW